MSVVHRIRLRGGWRVERAEDGSAVFERGFGAPRTMEAAETVWLVCDCMPGNGVVQVNGRKIGDAVAGSGFAGELTGVMLPRNMVRIELTGAGGAELGEVGLEFRTES